MSLTDPYFNTRRCIERLYAQYLRNPRLIIAVDFDDTLFDFHKTDATYPEVIRLLKRCNELDFYVVVFTSSANARHSEIRAYIDSLGIKIAGINTNPIPLPYGNEGKIFFNLLIDDRAGLGQACEILKKTLARIRRRQKALSTMRPLSS